VSLLYCSLNSLHVLNVFILWKFFHLNALFGTVFAQSGDQPILNAFEVF
jgi:hypothetical protein